jgi:hypothetical protein
MTVSQQPETPSPSRRALLAGALGGLGALVAGAIRRPTVSHAADGGNALIGMANTGTQETSFQNTDANETSLSGIHGTNGVGVYGESSSNIGVFGNTVTGKGVMGASGTGTGVYGDTGSTTSPAVLGRAGGNNTGVQGHSGLFPLASPAKTGVFGYAAQDSASVGVRGESPAGFGVYGKTTGTGFAGYFNGKTFMSQFVEIGEMSTPAAPAGNRARLFVRDNGLGKTQLCVRFPTGAVQVLATQA